jgi:CDP-paratose 2-epimerase
VIVPVNLMGAYHCFELAARHGAQVIFLSTSRVYPVAAIEELAYTEAETRYELAAEQPLPGASAEGLSERFPLDGSRTMYGASKLAGELLLAEYEIPWVVNRCGVVAGPWQMGKVDQGVFSWWLLSHHFGQPLKYIGYGGSGKQVRDLLHIADLIDLVDDQLSDPEQWSGVTVNVGGGRECSLSLLETTDLCRELTGNEVPTEAELETRPGDVPVYLSDCSHLHSLTSWRPRRGPRDVLVDLLDWTTEHEDALRAGLGFET